MTEKVVTWTAERVETAPGEAAVETVKVGLLTATAYSDRGRGGTEKAIGRRYGVDALVGPTTPAVAVAQGPGASSLETFLLFIRNTDPGSNAGTPGLTIPAGLGPSTGLPVGLSLDGPRGSDERLLAIGRAIEDVLGRTPAPRR